MSAVRVYFLCTGNSCRSQMAEGWARFLAERVAGERGLPRSWLEAESGGLEPSFVHPLAVRVMAERGVDISRQRSKGIDAERLRASDLCVTLCGDARDRCPVTPPSVRKLHWPLEDPARAEGEEAAVLAVFRRVRDEIEERVRALVEELAAAAAGSAGRKE
ncbi:MAG: arsenate reductase ArsC [Bacillota bacterium]|nr:arsenate reductase ArsC [Bacillota bacterium]